MRKVLIVAYYFPPLGGGGVQRTVKFVKYLPEFGWQPLVLATRQQASRLHDVSLEEEVPAGVTVQRTPALLLPSWLPWRVRHLVSRWLLLVDEQLGWLPFAAARGRELICREDVAAIYTSSAPYTALLIGLRLKKRTGCPWVADFRDPWIGNFSATFATPFHRRLAQRLEGQAVRVADQVIVVSEPMRQALLSRHAGLDPTRVLTIPNGYDPADFEIAPLGQEAGRMVVVYSGSFYGRQQTPLPFLQGLRAALDSGGVSRQQVRVRFVGSVSPAVPEQVAALDLTDIVQITGYRPHSESVGHLLGADLLLLVIGAGPGSDVVFTGKVFEYLAAGRPILALVPPGAAADLVREARAGVVVEPNDVPAIAGQLAALYRQWQQGRLQVAMDPQVVARFDRRRLTARLASVLDEIARGE